MSKFNTGATRPVGTGPIGSETVAGGRTFEGGPGFARDAKSELFLLAVTNMVGESAFYESAGDRDSRFTQLVRAVAVEDIDWLTRFGGWLRSEANMRSASLVLAAEAVRARLDANLTGSRALVSSVLQRADEPGEMVAYWHSRFGRTLPKPMKRGIADAATRLYSERCVTPDTLVLKRDLTWVRAGDLVTGDELVGFDEQIRSKTKGGAAKMQVSTVTEMQNAQLPTVRVRTDKGETSVSVDHQFVVLYDRKRTWKRAEDLKPGDRLCFFGKPWQTDSSREAGWMAGFLDGEGTIAKTHHKAGGGKVEVAQVSGPTCEYAKEMFKDLGFDISVQVYQAKGNRQQKETLSVLGGRYNSMRLLGTIGGVRLSRDSLWVGGSLVSKGPWVVPGTLWATVEGVDDLGIQENVTMSTSTKTFISDGFFSHNSVLKYDTDSRGVRFADVIQLAHAEPKAEWQSVLFKHVIEKRLGIEGLEIPDALAMLTANKALRAEKPETITAWAKSGVLADKLSAAGMTWEAVPSLVNGPWTKELWEAIIPHMGYMSTLRNLRNFDQAGVSDKVAAQVVASLIDPEAVAKSRQFPMRFLSAYKAAPSLRWAWPLEQALDLSLRNIPELSGRTLIMVDTSGSMNAPFSKDGTLMRWDSATVFGLGLARRCQSADVVSFSNSAVLFPQVKGESVLKSLDRWMKSGYFQNGGTHTSQALQAVFKGHDRVVILTDEQAVNAWGGDPGAVIPTSVPMYTWNVAGYKYGHAAGGANRYTFGGLSDACFKLIPLLERGSSAGWPF